MKLSLYLFKFIVFSIYCTSLNFATAQNKKAIKLSDKLEELEQKFSISFSYNHTFFDDIYLQNDFNCDDISDCLVKIEQMLPVNFNADGPDYYMLTPQRETLNFSVINHDNNELITNLEFQINKGNKQNIQAQNGVFTLQNIFPLDSISFFSEIYKNVQVSAQNLLNTSRLDFFKKHVHLDEIVLNGYLTKGIDAKVSDFSLQINTQTLGLLAGETAGDVFNVLNNIPGIHSPSGKSGNLNFRGNTYDQNLVQIDDIPIYHSGHFLGAISPYNASVISNIEVQRTMLPAKWGGRVGGLIDMTTSDKIPDSTNYEVAVNTLFAGATVKAKLIENKLSFLAAFRSSYPGFNLPKLVAISELIFQGSKLESVADDINTSDNFDFGFADMNAKLNYKINDKQLATISFINIQNNLSAEVNNKDNSDETDFRDLELNNWGITAKWEAKFSQKWKTEFRISRSRMNLKSVSQGFTLEEQSSLEKYDNTILDTRLITEVVYTYNPELTFETGYTLTEHAIISNELEQETDLDQERDERAMVHSSYLALQKNWNDKLLLNLGVHNNYYAPSKTFYLNPRFTASFTLNNNWYLKSSFGTSNQFIQKKFTNDFDDFNITNQLWYLPNDQISALKGSQFMIGSVSEFKNWLIDVELYSKTTNDITNKTDNVPGSIYSKGANLFVKKKWHTFEAWLSYALSETTTDFNGTTATAFFDQTHLLDITTLINLNRWKFALTWSYFTGMPVIFSDETDSDSSNLNLSDRFDALHQLDFSASYTFYNSSKSFKSVIGLSILNVYNADNTVNIFQNTSDSTFRKATNFSPNLQVNLFF